MADEQARWELERLEKLARLAFADSKFEFLTIRPRPPGGCYGVAAFLRGSSPGTNTFWIEVSQSEFGKTDADLIAHLRAQLPKL
jgi:hypothetical protein